MPEDGFSHDMTTELFFGHEQRADRARRVQIMYREALRDNFWGADNLWTTDLDGGRGYQINALAHGDGDDGISVKLQSNTMRPFVDSMVATLFYRAPRTTASPPAWVPKAKGRPKSISLDDAEAVAAVGDQFLQDASVESLTTDAMVMSIMYGKSGLKLGLDRTKKGEIPEKLWVDTIKPWDLMLDERSNPQKQRYIGHIRYQSVAEVMEQWPGKLDDDFEPTHLPDYLYNGAGDTVAANELTIAPRDQGYVRILEFYDFTKTWEGKNSKRRGVLTLYAVTGGGSEAKAKLVELESTAFPFYNARDEPVVPIIPVILENVPEFPLEGVPLVGSQYHLNAETNLMMSIMGSAARVDAGRVDFVDKQLLPDTSDIEGGGDRVLIGIETKGDPNALKRVVVPMEQPRVPNTIERFMNILEGGKRDAQTRAPVTRGEQTPYATKSEVELLAQFSENNASRPRERMDKALETMLSIMATIVSTAMSNSGEKELRLRKGEETIKVKREILAENWSFTIIDSANTPLKEVQRRQEFLGVIDPLIAAVTILSESEAILQGGEPTPGPDGQPAANDVGAETKARMLGNFARAELAYMIDLWNLPETFNVEHLLGKAEEKRRKGGKLSAEDLIEMLGSLSPEEQLAIMQQLAPPEPAPPQGGQLVDPAPSVAGAPVALPPGPGPGPAGGLGGVPPGGLI